MGNNNFKCGNIFVQTDKPYYQAGDTVTGHVHVNMTSLFPSDIIYLKIKGYEKCKWSERLSREVEEDGKSKTEYYYEHFEADKSFYSHKIQLYSWGIGTIPIGQYSIPFSFVLQSQLPGTFNEEGELEQNGESYKAVIKYKIKAETAVPHGFDKMKHSQELIVREPVKQEVKGSVGEMNKKTSVCCCINKGETKIKCYFEQNTYIPGDSARIITEVDNSGCQLDIKDVKGQLYKVIKLESKNHTKTIERSVTATGFGSINAGEKKEGEDALRTNINLTSKSKPIQPSTTGNLVSCRYYLKVSSEMDGMICCSENPQVSLPIQLVAPPPLNYGTVQQPPNWAPQVFSVPPLAFTTADMYAKGGLSVNLNLSGQVNAPPGGMNQPPQMGMQINQPPGQPQVQVTLGGPDEVFNAPPQQVDSGFNQPPQEGFNQPPQQQQINAPPGGQMDVNMNMNMNMNMNVNNMDMQVQVTELETTTRTINGEVVTNITMESNTSTQQFNNNFNNEPM